MNNKPKYQINFFPLVLTIAVALILGAVVWGLIQDPNSIKEFSPRHIFFLVVVMVPAFITIGKSIVTRVDEEENKTEE